MKKFTTIKRLDEFFGKGHELEEDILLEWFTPKGVKCLIKDGWIEEIQEPEFTRNDMERAFNAGINLADVSNLTHLFNNWLSKYKP